MKDFQKDLITNEIKAFEQKQEKMADNPEQNENLFQGYLEEYVRIIDSENKNSLSNRLIKMYFSSNEDVPDEILETISRCEELHPQILEIEQKKKAAAGGTLHRIKQATEAPEESNKNPLLDGIKEKIGDAKINPESLHHITRISENYTLPGEVQVIVKDKIRGNAIDEIEQRFKEDKNLKAVILISGTSLYVKDIDSPLDVSNLERKNKKEKSSDFDANNLEELTDFAKSLLKITKKEDINEELFHDQRVESIIGALVNNLPDDFVGNPEITNEFKKLLKTEQALIEKIRKGVNYEQNLKKFLIERKKFNEKYKGEVSKEEIKTPPSPEIAEQIFLTNIVDKILTTIA